MHQFFSIIFDDKTKEQIISYYKLEENNNSYISTLLESPQIEYLGNFLFNFIEINFENKLEFNKFVSTYCFESLYYMTYPNQYPIKNINMKISKEEYIEFLELFYTSYSNEFCLYRDILYDFINLKERLDYFCSYEKSYNYKNFENSLYNFKNLKSSDYKKYLNIDLKRYLININLDFNFTLFQKLNTNNYEYAFNTNNLYSFLFIIAWKLSKLDYIILKCQNCGKYFIPDSKHETKYCNFMFCNNKTCRELGAQLNYKKKLNNDPVLRKCRTFYQSLQKNASIYGGNYTTRYENFKKELPIMKQSLKEGNISVTQFNEWLKSKKIRK